MVANADEQGVDVLLVGPGSSHPGGISLYTDMLARALADSARVRVIHLDPVVPPGLYPFVRRGSGLVGRDDASTLALEAFRLNPFSLGSWLGFVQRLRAESSHSALIQWWSATVAPTLAVAMLLFFIRGMRIYLDVHETVDPTEERMRLVALCGRWILRRFGSRAAVVVHSESQESAIRALVRPFPVKTKFIPHPLYGQYPQIDRDLAKKELGLGRRHLVLAFGTIRAYKGLETLIEAYESLPDTLRADTQVAIVGGLWRGESEGILAKARETALAGGIVLRPEYVSDKEAGLWFSAADLVVQAYRRGAPSGVTSIAMAFGLPCIVSAQGGTRRLAGIYDGLFEVDPDDPQVLCDRIREILGSPSVRYPIPSRLNWTSVSQEYMDFLRASP